MRGESQRRDRGRRGTARLSACRRCFSFIAGRLLASANQLLNVDSVYLPHHFRRIRLDIRGKRKLRKGDKRRSADRKNCKDTCERTPERVALHVTSPLQPSESAATSIRREGGLGEKRAGRRGKGKRGARATAPLAGLPEAARGEEVSTQGRR